jgi:predicted ArsR family transcriptional regulator
MDPFDERILKVLGDCGKRSFSELSSIVGFSHNTLRLHLESLVDGGLVLKEKMPKKGHGRPMFTYALSPSLKHQIIRMLSEPYIEFVSLPFSKLRLLCRFEKGGYCKKIRAVCEAKKCPEIPKEQ